MTYDVHAHAVPLPVLDALRADDGRCGVEVVDVEGTPALRFGNGSARPIRSELTDVGARLRAMDDAGVDVQLLSSWIGISGYRLPPEQGTRWARLFNESLAQTVAEHPDRFLGLCNVPLQSPPDAAAELRHAVEVLGMVGTEIATTVAGRELDDPGLEPFWAAAEELRCLVLLHPDQTLAGRPEPRYFLNNLVGNAAETTIALAHMLHSGVFERHPELRVCLVHGGGYLPWQMGRMDHGFEAAPDKVAAHISRPPSSYLRRLYYDTVTHSPAALRFLIDTVGVGQVVLGSDYPFEMGERDPVGLLESVPGLGDEDRRAVREGNLRRLLDDLRRG